MSAEVVNIPRLLTEREAAAILDVSLATLRRKVKCGEIGCYEFCRKRKFSEDHLNAYLESVECPKKLKNGHTEECSSHVVPTAQTGIAAGFMQKPGRPARFPSALATKKKQSDA